MSTTGELHSFVRRLVSVFCIAGIVYYLGGYREHQSMSRGTFGSSLPRPMRQGQAPGRFSAHASELEDDATSPINARTNRGFRLRTPESPVSAFPNLNPQGPTTTNSVDSAQVRAPIGASTRDEVHGRLEVSKQEAHSRDILSTHFIVGTQDDFIENNVLKNVYERYKELGLDVPGRYSDFRKIVVKWQIHEQTKLSDRAHARSHTSAPTIQKLDAFMNARKVKGGVQVTLGMRLNPETHDENRFRLPISEWTENRTKASWGSIGRALQKSPDELSFPQGEYYVYVRMGKSDGERPIHHTTLEGDKSVKVAVFRRQQDTEGRNRELQVLVGHLLAPLADSLLIQVSRAEPSKLEVSFATRPFVKESYKLLQENGDVLEITDETAAIPITRLQATNFEFSSAQTDFSVIVDLKCYLEKNEFLEEDQVKTYFSEEDGKFLISLSTSTSTFGQARKRRRPTSNAPNATSPDL